MGIVVRPANKHICQRCCVCAGDDGLPLRVLDSNPAAQAFWRAMRCTDYFDTMRHDLEEDHD